MPLDKETMDFLIELRKDLVDRDKELKKDLKEVISVTGSLNRAKMMNHLDPIADDIAEIKNQNTIRNGRLEAQEKDLDEQKKNTAITIWAHKNPKISISLAGIFIVFLCLSSIFTYHKLDNKQLDVAKTIEKNIPLVFEDKDNN